MDSNNGDKLHKGCKAEDNQTEMSNMERDSDFEGFIHDVERSFANEEKDKIIDDVSLKMTQVHVSTVIEITQNTFNSSDVFRTNASK